MSGPFDKAYQDGYRDGADLALGKLSAKEQEAVRKILSGDDVTSPLLRGALEKVLAAEETGAEYKPSAAESGALRRYAKMLETQAGALGDKRELIHASMTHIKAIQDLLARGFVMRTVPRHTHPPTIKAHEIIEQLGGQFGSLLGDHLDYKQDIETPLSHETRNTLLRWIVSAQKFDLRPLKQEDIEPNYAFSLDLHEKGLFKFPYERCWFEWELQPDLTIACLALRTESGATLCLFGKVPGAPWASWSFKQHKSEIEDHVTRVTQAACVIMSSKGAERTNVPAPDRLNKKREQAGKPPIFSHTVVEVRGLTHFDAESGATTFERRSPRMHWRRGHLRHLRDGRIIPIPPCLVGNSELGFITHDYRASA